MEPLSLILGALSAGALAATKDLADQAIKDAYQALKTLLQRKFDGQPHAQMALDQHALDPATWEKPLQKALTSANADQDLEIIRAAAQLLSILPEQNSAEKYALQVTGNVQGMVAGDGARVHMTFQTNQGEGSHVPTNRRRRTA